MLTKRLIIGCILGTLVSNSALAASLDSQRYATQQKRCQQLTEMHNQGIASWGEVNTACGRDNEQKYYHYATMCSPDGQTTNLRKWIKGAPSPQDKKEMNRAIDQRLQDGYTDGECPEKPEPVPQPEVVESSSSSSAVSEASSSSSSSNSEEAREVQTTTSEESHAVYNSSSSSSVAPETYYDDQTPPVPDPLPEIAPQSSSSSSKAPVVVQSSSSSHRAVQTRPERSVVKSTPKEQPLELVGVCRRLRNRTHWFAVRVRTRCIERALARGLTP